MKPVPPVNEQTMQENLLVVASVASDSASLAGSVLSCLACSIDPSLYVRGAVVKP